MDFWRELSIFLFPLEKGWPCPALYYFSLSVLISHRDDNLRGKINDKVSLIFINRGFMKTQAEEMYVGAIFRLREDKDKPVSLQKLKDYFNFSPISIHEMIIRLESQSLLTYQPYRGVILTASGEQVATALIRRHRIWERFLADTLGIDPQKVHPIADQLEHSASEEVTERLAAFLGEPESCPHGSLIPPAPNS